MRYQHILGATDFSELGNLAVQRAIDLALANGARLTLLHVLPELQAPSPLLPRYYDVHTDGARLAQAKASAEQALRECVPETARDAGLELACEVRVGDPASEILAVDARLRPELIVIATHGRSGLSRWLLGSVAQRVTALAKADVLAIRGRGSDE